MKLWILYGPVPTHFSGALALVADGHDAVEVLAELVGDGGVGLLEADPHRVGVHLLELVRIDRGEPGRAEEPFLRVQDALDRVDDVVGGQGLAVVELDARPEAHVDLAGHRGVDLLRQPVRRRGRSPRRRSASVSQLPIRRVWSGLVTMLWPSMMSLAPPPVTPRRKLPPFLGVPAAGVEPPPLRGRRRAAAAAGRQATGEQDPARTYEKLAAREREPVDVDAGFWAADVHHRKLPSWSGEVSHRTMLPPPRGRRDNPPSPPPCQVNDVHHPNTRFARRDREKPPTSSARALPTIGARPRYSGRRPAGGRPPTWFRMRTMSVDRAAGDVLPKAPSGASGAVGRAGGGAAQGDRRVAAPGKRVGARAHVRREPQHRVAAPRHARGRRGSSSATR